MKKNENFIYRGMKFELTEGKDGNETRCRVFLYEEKLGRRLQNGDLKQNAQNPGRTVQTSFLRDGDPAKDRQQKYRAADRLLKKAAPYFSAAYAVKDTLAQVYEQEIGAFLQYASVRLPRSTQWNPKTCRANRSTYERYLVPIYRGYELPFSEADRQSFLQQLEQLKLSTMLYNRVLNLHQQLMEYLSGKKGLSVGRALELTAKPLTEQELMRQRMGSVRSFTPEFRQTLLASLLEKIESAGPQSAMAMGVLTMFFTGLRTAEMLACTLEDLCLPLYYAKVQIKQDVRSGQLKRSNSYRNIPVVSVLRRAAACRQENLARQLQISAAEAGKLPVAGSDRDPRRTMSETAFAAAARELFLELGISQTLLAAYTGLMRTVPVEELRDESSVCAYILRRDYITRLYNYTALSQKDISYLAGHAQEDGAVYRPNEAALLAAGLAMEQAFGDIPVRDEDMPVPVWSTAFSLPGGRMLQAVAAERNDAMDLTITGEPGTQVALVIGVRLDAPDTSPVCRAQAAGSQ